LGNELLGRKFQIFSIWTIRTNRIFYLPTTAALVPRPVGSSTLLLVVLILLSVLQVACTPCVRITTCSFVGSLV
jgi:hypothetical protein